MSAPVYRCRICKKRIPKLLVDRALSRGKVPVYCGPSHRETGKSRIKRARKLSSSS